MFCPSCGLEDRHANQFCRACGSDLRNVRLALEKPDNITESAVSARDEIGRAVAAKIRETRSLADLAEAADDLLPEIEKFLESPEEKRLRGVRNGTIISFIGLGAAIAFSLIAAFVKDDLVILAGMGVVCLFIGLSFIVNGLFFTVPRKRLSDKSTEAESQRRLDGISDPGTSELVLPPASANDLFTSVTEHTTHQLKSERPAGKK